VVNVVAEASATEFRTLYLYVHIRLMEHNKTIIPAFVVEEAEVLQ
jgi:hypothetical protein